MTKIMQVLRWTVVVLVAVSGGMATVAGLAALPMDRWPALLALLVLCLLSGAMTFEVPLTLGGA